MRLPSSSKITLQNRCFLFLFKLVHLFLLQLVRLAQVPARYSSKLESMNGPAAAALLWSLLVLGSAPSSADVPDITQQSFIDGCVEEHNRARSSVQPAARGMKDMVGAVGHTLATLWPQLLHHIHGWFRIQLDA